MGKYTELTKGYVQKFKPLIEKNVGLSLGDIIVREIGHVYDKPGCPMQVDPWGNTIIVNDSIYQKYAKELDKKGLVDKYLGFNLQHASLHEMSHLVHYKLTPRYLLNMMFNVSFIEGFAVYMSLEHLSSLYDNDTDLKESLEYIKNVFSKPLEHNALLSGLDYDPFHRGYEFFKEVLKELGKDKIFEVAAMIPETEEELVKPELYVQRFLRERENSKLLENIKRQMKEK